MKVFRSMYFCRLGLLFSYARSLESYDVGADDRTKMLMNLLLINTSVGSCHQHRVYASKINTVHEFPNRTQTSAMRLPHPPPTSLSNQG